MGSRRRSSVLLAVLGAVGVVSPACTAAQAAPSSLPTLVLTSDRDGDPEILVRTPDGRTRQLTRNSVSDYGAVWSPDGTRLAFVRGSEEGGGDDIWVMDADGRNQRRLTEPAVTADGVPALDMAPTWSPDGTRIAFASSRDGTEMKIYVMDADGGNQVRLSDSAPFVTDHTPAFSPDGEHIVFASTRAGADNTEIYRMRADGTDVRRLTRTRAGAEDSAPEYSPDGSRILFSSTRGGAAHDLWTMTANGTDARPLGGEPGLTDDVFGRWTADGRQVVFQTFGTEEPFRDSVWIVDADGRDRRRISDGSASEFLPDPAPAPAPRR